MAISAEQLALDVVRRLQAAGHTAYFAGGCVRDRLMGRAPKDFDVATGAVPEEVLRIFPRSQKVGVAFGVVIVRAGRAQVEVATFRTEGAYSDGRRPDTVAFTTPEVDARRRDFTCNGIFFDPLAGTIHDYVGGQADIAARTLRAIGEPHHRFGEDHLRMIRAVRFAAKLDFKIEEATFAAIGELAEKIRGISRERIGEEMRMILEHGSRAEGARLLAASGLLAQIWPEALYGEGSEGFTRLANVVEPVDRAMGLLAMQLDLRAEVWPANVAEGLRGAFMLSNEETADLGWMMNEYRAVGSLKTLRVAKTKRLLADPRWGRLWRVAAKNISAEDAAVIEGRVAVLVKEGVAPPPMVTGDVLIKLGGKPGPEFRRWLDELYDRQLENEFSSREEAVAAARRMVG